MNFQRNMILFVVFAGLVYSNENEDEEESQYSVTILNNSIEYYVGDDVRLTCIMSKYYYKNPSWIFENSTEQLPQNSQIILPSENIQIKNSTIISTIFISNIQHDHNGRWSCQANPINSSFFGRNSDSMLLEVHDPIPPTIVSSNMKDKVKKVTPGSTVQLWTVCDGNEYFSVDWYKNGNRVSFGNHILRNNKGKNHTLTIKNVTKEDEGNYTFIACNKFGNTSISVNLMVIIQGRTEESHWYFKRTVIIICMIIFLLCFHLAFAYWYLRKLYKEQNRSEMSLPCGLEQRGSNEDSDINYEKFV